ncbi:hypothetical protein [Arthrobacter koreensis]|uniref:hypothetical protein n=1 Tax=Arthrobacter koreensis TaxID=199136 RepID=UPI002DBEE23E|nr:hypothetical protein [Arthrobacter koreensis]MEB7504944.1 hypothetical protein [Arthrobacter koreensis]
MTGPVKVPKDRTAHASIRGYCYQFDRTILEILEADAETDVLVEGLEDVDLLDPNQKTVAAVQVKYWASKKYATPRSIHEPIELMLKAYVSGAKHSFILHAHFGLESHPPARFTVDDLVACLTPSRSTKRQKELGKPLLTYTREELSGFAERLTIRVGPDFDTQNTLVRISLAKHLSATEQDVNDLYYAAALSHIQALAMNPNIKNRRIRRSDFLTLINNKEALYTRWHSQTVSADDYATALARRLKDQKMLRPTKRKAIIVTVSSNEDDVKRLACSLAETEYGPGKIHTTKPWTLIVDGSEDQVRQIKLAVIRNGISINDGYESFEFQPHIFDTPPVINRRSGGDIIKLASYAIRIISFASFCEFVKNGYRFDQIMSVKGLEDDLCRTGSTNPPIFYQGLSAAHIQKVIGGSSNGRK